ncbi:hypothetical protein Pfo_014028 [Paulownia fortunei]|nr:hypothetical protein Pfo_014028 [Paulownia fortunei]
MTSFNHDYFQCCFQDWIAQQHQDLEELLNAVSTDSETTDEELKLLCEKGIKHFEEYCERRALMVQHDAPSFMSPSWCSSFENAFLWIGGCRPSLFVRLVYSVCGSQLNSQLNAFLRGERKGNLAEIPGQQLDMINTLHCKTIKDEEKISTKMANNRLLKKGKSREISCCECAMQEEIAYEPLAIIAKSAGQVGEWSQDLDRAMNAHSLSLARILVDADRLRLNTLKELLAILTPLQAVDFLVATKKLHISMHEWGERRDRQFGNPS